MLPISRKDFMLFLAAILVVAMGFMAITLSNQQRKSSYKPASANYNVEDNFDSQFLY